MDYVAPLGICVPQQTHEELKAMIQQWLYVPHFVIMTLFSVVSEMHLFHKHIYFMQINWSRANYLSAVYMVIVYKMLNFELWHNVLKQKTKNKNDLLKQNREST